MKIVIAVASLIAFASGIPHPDVDPVVVQSGYIPQEFRRDAVPEEMLTAEAGDANLDDSYVPEAIFINYVDIDPSQTNMNDLLEFVKDASRVLEINPGVIEIADAPLNQVIYDAGGFIYEPVQIVNSLPVAEKDLADKQDAEKVIVVDSPVENSNDEIPQMDMVQVVNALPKDNVIPEESSVNDVDKVEMVNKPINDEQNDVVQVASIPIQNSEKISPADDEIRAVKFVESPNMDGNENFVGVPMGIAPSELDSLRVDFQGEEYQMPLDSQDDKVLHYPQKLYPNPWLR